MASLLKVEFCPHKRRAAECALVRKQSLQMGLVEVGPHWSGEGPPNNVTGVFTKRGGTRGEGTTRRHGQRLEWRCHSRATRSGKRQEGPSLRPQGEAASE